MADQRDSAEGRSGRSWLAALGWMLLCVVLGSIIGLVAMFVVLGSSGLRGAGRQAVVSASGEVAASLRSVLPFGEHALKSIGGTVSGPHITLSNGPPLHPKSVTFWFEGVRHTVVPHVPNAVYWGAKRSTRYLIQVQGESQDRWTATYYRAFAEDPAQKAAINDVCAQLLSISRREGLDSDQYLELIAKYVQSIPYDWKDYRKGIGLQRFPAQTLVDGTGMCGDKSVLLADLLAHEGYSAALLSFGPEQHMVVGVKGPGPTFMSTGYLFLETTAPMYVTDVPSQYADGMKLTSEPVVIPIGKGTREYSASGQIAEIIRARDAAAPAAEALYKQTKGLPLTGSQASSINDKLKLAYTAETCLRSNVVNKNGVSVGSFKDRTVAIGWIQRNAWWM